MPEAVEGEDMNRLIAMTSLAAALVLPILAAPASASASCEGRKMTGTVLGGVGGALIGNSIARGGGGAVIGGLGGAVLGHEIAGAGCYRHRHTAYYSNGQRFRSGVAAQPRAVRYVYYDQYGDPVAEGPIAGAAAHAPAANGDAGAPACHTEMQSFYDDRGGLVQRPVPICAR